MLQGGKQDKRKNFFDRQPFRIFFRLTQVITVIK